VREWRMRVPQLLIAWALPLTAAVVFGVGWSQPVEDESIQDVVSIGLMAEYFPVWLFVLATLLGWVRPRLGLWTLMISLLILVPNTRTPDEFAVQAFWFGLVITDVVLARRQASLARNWTRLEHHSLDPARILNVSRSVPWMSWVVSAISLLLALVVLGLWVNARGNLADFDARAVSRDAEVTSLDKTFDYVEFRVDGREYEMQVWDAADYEVGETIPVRVDPEGEFNPVGPEEGDPQGTLFWGPLCAPLFLISVLALLTPRFRHRDRMRAFADSRPVRARVRPANADGGIVLLTDDGLPFAYSRRVSTYYDPSRYQSQVLAPNPDEADGLHEARVYGLTRFGRTALVEIPALGILLVPKSSLRDPFTIRALFRRETKSVRVGA
jgi:hypothetical protein